MAKKHEPAADGAAEEKPEPTAYQAAMAEIAAEANKLVAGGMGTHDAHALALDVWKHCSGK